MIINYSVESRSELELLLLNCRILIPPESGSVNDGLTVADTNCFYCEDHGDTI